MLFLNQTEDIVDVDFYKEMFKEFFYYINSTTLFINEDYIE